jgi:hypothetical protein
VEIIAVNGETLQSAFGEHVAEVGRLHRDASAAAQRMHQETIAAILTLRDGNTKVVTTPNQDGVVFGGINRSMTIREGSEHEQGASRHSEVVLDDFGLVVRQVLDCLYFRRITDRVEEVASAHQRTFEWIFYNPTAEQKPWTNFVTWLRHGHGCYWINGKAGSGKSTLMKYIQKDVRTKAALEIWADQRTLITPSFFFWNLGSRLQKTQKGLLRSLLFEILGRHQGLIPSVLPGLCRAALADKTDQQLEEPSFAELRYAFVNLVQQTSHTLKICFFIDGIDEFEGNFEELLDLITSISCSLHVKFVLSSRPIPICVDTFSQHARLRLQDLTYNDIRFYVEDKLANSPHISRLRETQETLTTDLVAEVCDKASGVFLWVILVVRSLLEGFRNFDGISDLRRRLHELPADLENLYEHMLHTMSPLYRQQASQIFQIMMGSRTVQDERPVTLLQLSFAEDEDPMTAVRASLGPLPKSVRLSRCEITEGRLRSRCCGLLEVQDRRVFGKAGAAVVRPCVGFLHKTVVEFLQLPHNWTNIVGLTADTAFDPYVALMASCLYDLKTCALENQILLAASPDSLWPLCRILLEYAMMAEDSTKRAQTAFIDEFDRTMEAYVTYHGGHIPVRGGWTWRVGLRQSFMSLAVKCGLDLYVKDKLRQNSFITRVDMNNLETLLSEALCAFICTFPGVNIGKVRVSTTHSQASSLKPEEFWPDYRIPPSHFANLVHTLLQYGADPNHVSSPQRQSFGERAVRTPWQLFLSHAFDLVDNDPSQINYMLHEFSPGSLLFLLTDILRHFVIHGADLNTPAMYASGRTNPSTLIRVLLTSQTGQWHSSASCALAQSVRDELIALIADHGAATKKRAVFGRSTKQHSKANSISKSLETSVPSAWTSGDGH